MNKHFICLPFAVLVASLTACTPPTKDIPGLTSEIDAAMAGHYGQSMYHEELAEESLEDANEILEHWKNDHYWNIDLRQKAMSAAEEAAHHRKESEKELCKWLTSVHSHNHHQGEVAQHAAAYFKTGSAVPYQTNHHEITSLGKYLETHPDAAAQVTAYTDTVGSVQSNQILSEKRASSIVNMLIAHGARASQLSTKALGEAEGPDRTANQKHRVVMISTAHPNYIDCPDLK